MSDENYFGPPNGHRGPRERRSSDHSYFHDPRDEEYDEHGPLEGESLNEVHRSRLLTPDQYRRWKEGRNPHGK